MILRVSHSLLQCIRICLVGVIQVWACQAGHSQSEELIDVLSQGLTASDEVMTINSKAITNRYTSGEALMNALKSSSSATMDSTGQRIRILRHIMFENCQFESSLMLSGVEVQGLDISDSSLPDISIGQSNFGVLNLNNNRIHNAVEIQASGIKTFGFRGNTVSFDAYLENCTFSDGDVSIENNVIQKGEIDLVSIRCNAGVTIGNNQVTGVLIENSTFDIPEYGEFNNYKLPGTPPSDLYLIENIFNGDSTSRVSFNKGSYLNLDVRKNTFNTNVYFIENHVDDRFFLVGNTFKTNVSFEKFLFSEIWNELYWDQLAGYKLRYGDYGALDSLQMVDQEGFKNLINIYKKMHAIFLSRGDLQSANACYSEMKQLQGKMLKHIYMTRHGFNNFFRWQLNVLLKIYTNHGTDPALAVIMSFYIIFVFAILYLFFPSEWDVDSRNRMLVSYEKLLGSRGRKFLNPLLVVAGSISLTLLNSLTLSINSFVTLGFGHIPTRGFARYLCIIEGFIGWFLLSIFTVALINQVLA